MAFPRQHVCLFVTQAGDNFKHVYKYFICMTMLLKLESKDREKSRNGSSRKKKGLRTRIGWNVHELKKKVALSTADSWENTRITSGPEEKLCHIYELRSCDIKNQLSLRNTIMREQWKVLICGQVKARVILNKKATLNDSLLHSKGKRHDILLQDVINSSSVQYPKWKLSAREYFLQSVIKGPTVYITWKMNENFNNILTTLGLKAGEVRLSWEVILFRPLWWTAKQLEIGYSAWKHCDQEHILKKKMSLVLSATILRIKPLAAIQFFQTRRAYLQEVVMTKKKLHL